MKCIFTKPDNIACNANAMDRGQYCFFHDPNIPEEKRKEAQSRGGKANVVVVKTPLPPIKVKEIRDVVALLEDAINQVRAGELDVRIGNCIGVLSGHLIKALEVATVANRVEIIERAILEKRTKFS